VFLTFFLKNTKTYRQQWHHFGFTVLTEGWKYRNHWFHTTSLEFAMGVISLIRI
jgi:hypothetical protein